MSSEIIGYSLSSGIFGGGGGILSCLMSRFGFRPNINVRDPPINIKFVGRRIDGVRLGVLPSIDTEVF